MSEFMCSYSVTFGLGNHFLPYFIHVLVNVHMILNLRWSTNPSPRSVLIMLVCRCV